jgi:hypothetical protein
MQRVPLRYGACLAIAELARRGLLIPARLPDAVPHVAAALSYDVRRGPHSVGAHVVGRCTSNYHFCQKRQRQK